MLESTYQCVRILREDEISHAVAVMNSNRVPLDHPSYACVLDSLRWQVQDLAAAIGDANCQHVDDLPISHSKMKRIYLQKRICATI